MANTTLVLGASVNTSRYSNIAVLKLVRYSHEVIAYGTCEGQIGNISITKSWPTQDVDTVTLYIGPERQEEYYSAIIALRPRRIIFNPGTENHAFYKLLEKTEIEFEEACTLMMLGAGTY
jgi:predicted CoA-binding protein